LQRIKDIERKIEIKDTNRDGVKSERRKEERGREEKGFKTFPKLDFDSKQF
jgi:hypothetical protein